MANQQGLSTQEVNVRRQAYGSNTIPESEPPAWRRLLAKLWAPVPWMLEAAILLQFMLREYLEAAVIALLLLFNAALGLLQEGRAQATLKALKSRLALLAVVRRDGAWQILPAGDIVPDDVIKLTLGSIVPADVVLLEGELLLDQSMLTGESLPVEAAAGAHTYAGALVRRGEALAQVVATGVRTKFGRTAELVGAAHAAELAATGGAARGAQPGLFQRRDGDGAAAVRHLYRHVGRGNDSARPHRGAGRDPGRAACHLHARRRLAARALVARNVLPTRLSAIDEAATIDVLCADKTGTLTQNELAVTGVLPAAGPRCGAVALPRGAGERRPRHGSGGRRGARRRRTRRRPAPDTRISFVPFDPSRRTAEAQLVDALVGPHAFSRVPLPASRSSPRRTATLVARAPRPTRRRATACWPWPRAGRLRCSASACLRSVIRRGPMRAS